MKKLLCVDTFSGIGGISLGLKDFCTVVQYCEWDGYCQRVLSERMKEGRLDRAPIHADIKTLYLCPEHAPDMICGGFPCQDISSMGLQKGIRAGERSSMFFHMMRLVDETPSIRVVFLENVANILSCGMHEVVDALVARGFSLVWTVRTAAAQGAPHVRARWFCLATRGEVDLETGVESIGVGDWWKEEPGARFTLKTDEAAYDPQWVQRCHTLGNAVVPSVVRAAYVELVRCLQKKALWTACLEGHGVDVKEWKGTYPDHGLIADGTFYVLPKLPMKENKHTVDTRVQAGDKVVRLVHWPTPRRGLTHGSTLTERSMRDLPTVLLHSVSSMDALKAHGLGEEKPHKVAIASVPYIEWMMGYEKDWTKVALEEKTKRRVQEEEFADGGEEGVEEEPMAAPAPASFRPKVRWNGMHMLMRENPGKDIRSISQMWRALTQEERAVYSQQAREAT